MIARVINFLLRCLGRLVFRRRRPGLFLRRHFPASWPMGLLAIGDPECGKGWYIPLSRNAGPWWRSRN